METNVKTINQSAINQIQEKEQALNGWIAIDSAGNATATGNFSGIKVMAGDTLTIALTFKSGSPCEVNGVTIDLVEGDYLPTPGLVSATATVGKCFLIKSQQ